jgi:hypothetical protein
MAPPGAAFPPEVAGFAAFASRAVRFTMGYLRPFPSTGSASPADRHATYNDIVID